MRSPILSLPRPFLLHRPTPTHSLTTEVGLAYAALFLLAAALAHYGLLLLDRTGAADEHRHEAGASHLYMFWICILNTVTTAIAVVHNPHFEFYSFPGQVWIVVVALWWWLQLVIVIANLNVIELERRERRRDHDPETM